MNKDESFENVQQASEQYAQELEQQHEDEDRHLQKLEDEVDKHLAISIDVHKSFSFAFALFFLQCSIIISLGSTEYFFATFSITGMKLL